jgi:hypothetical protein
MVKRTQNVTNNVSFDSKCNTDLFDNKLLKSVNIRFLNPSSISQESIPIFNSAKILKIHHQDICGLQHKINELIGHLDENLPQVFCSSEYHLKHMAFERKIFGPFPVTKTKTCLLSRICKPEHQTSIYITGLALG